MNPNDAVKEALAKVRVEERRLTDQLDKVRAVRRALERQLGVGPGAEKLSRINAAPAGALPEAILKAIPKGRKAQTRAEIIATINRTSYPYSLTPLHVTKNLLRLVKERKLVRVGNDRNSAYRKP